jgi:AcrR family transcriptional regulator
VNAPVQPSLQERRRDYTVREISRVAMRLFSERGFDAVTVEDIAAEVGMSARTFFRYFASKDEVVLQYQRRLQGRLVAVFETHAANEAPITALRNAYVATSVVAPEDRNEIVLVGRFLMDSETLLARTRGAQAAGNDQVVAVLAAKLGIDPDRDSLAETIASVMSAAASTAFHRWVATGGHGDPAEPVAASLDVLMQGLATFDKAGKSLKRGDRK